MHRSKGFTPAKANAFTQAESGAFSRKREAFTLIELLVVIAIIAILAAILFPVFAQAREKARQTACLSNTKQIANGLLMYQQDYDETLPFFFFGPDGGASNAATGRYKWMDAIQPYIKSEQIFNCPSASFPMTVGNDVIQRYRYYQNQASTGTNPLYYGSYAINTMYRYDTGPRTPPTGRYLVGVSAAAIGNPAGTVWLGDGLHYFFGWSCLASGSGCTSTQPATVVNTTVKPPRIDDRLVGRHMDMSNIVYTDGHAKATTLTALASQRKADGTLTAFTIEDD